MMKGNEHALLLFDGVCNLCNTSVQFIIKRDKHDYFRFAPLSSKQGQAIIKQHPHLENVDSLILVEDGQVYTRSTAALRVAKRLKGLWPVFGINLLLPEFIRNSVYDMVAANRYKMFGKQDSCMIPTPELRDKFITN